jgi:hypothetical protein
VVRYPPIGDRVWASGAEITDAPDGRQVCELNGLAGDVCVCAVASDGTLNLTPMVHGLPAFKRSNGMHITVT